MKLLPAFALLLAASFAQAEDAAPVKPPTLRETVNSLTDPDLKEFLKLLRENYIKPEVLTDAELSRATIQGVIERLSPGVSIRPAPAAGSEEASPFKSEIIETTIGYLRLGSLLPANLTQLDAALQEFSTKKLNAVVLDLRATPAGSEFEQAAEVCKRFCPKGRILFTVRKPNVQHEEILTSKEEPKYHGLLVALVDSDTAGAGEIIAAVLRTQARAMVIGQQTRGEAVEFAEVPLPSGKLLRVAVAEAALPDSTPVFPGGVKPDLAVEVAPETTAAVLKQGLESGVAALIIETERSKMNEAALVAGRNPDLDALQASQANKGERPKAPLRDVVLQRAVDFITTISLYEKKPGSAGK
jgi:hypothetical protein